MWACINSKFPAVKILLEHGANVNVCSSTSGRTALMWASLNGDLATVHCLIENGADLDVQNNVRCMLEILAVLQTLHYTI